MKIFHGKTPGISSTPIASTTKKNVNSLKIDVLFFLVTHFVTHFSFREEEKAAPPAIVIGLWGCFLRMETNRPAVAPKGCREK